MRPAQLPLPFVPPASSARADLLEDASNAEALAFLDRPNTWPAGRLALHGPPGVGKSHALRAAASAGGWRRLDGAALTAEEALAPVRGTALDDADRADPVALFHLINRGAETGAKLLLAAREPPSRWPVALPDLASRLRATHAVGIGHPSDALMEAVLGKLLADRQLTLDAVLRPYLLARLPREAGALAAAVAAIDRAALAAGGAVTRPLLRAVLDGLGWNGDGSVAEGTSPSPRGALLR
ncbi:MAG TPA: DNA replication protein [Acetobacteraceae bacterium]|nr:DNA replication protein [Acetobacteraceae bacterium]